MRCRKPAIIPQVYLHYDPYTIRDLPNGSALIRQLMDFLLLPYRQRVVIEIDGKHRCAEARQQVRDGIPAWLRRTVTYASRAYRFGGWELTDDNAREREGRS